MNCSGAQSLLLAERDGVLSQAQHADLAGHLGTCAACREFRGILKAATDAMHAEAARVTVPDAAAEWQALQPKLTGKPARRPPAPIYWIGAPLAAAAALALAYIGFRQSPPDADIIIEFTDNARADYVELADTNASTVVYVDKDSGWLVVWAVDDAAGAD